LYSEAIEILRYAQKGTHIPGRVTVAMLLAQFSFPLEQKFEVIDRTIREATALGGQVWSLSYFLEPFRKAESDYHKGSPPIKGEMMKISDILGVKE
jgi:hypothetical protein